MINYSLLTRITAEAVDGSKLPHAELTGSTLKIILSFLFGVAGAIALLVITISGFRYTLSRGNPDSIKNAKNSIIYAMVGLVVTLSAYAIVQFVFRNVKR